MIVVTGRMFRSVRPYVQEAGLDEPVICYQGAVVAEPSSGRFLLHIPIPLELAQETIAAVEEAGFGLNCYVGDDLYVAEVTEWARAYADFQNLPIEAVGDLRSWLSEPPTKLVAVGDPDALDVLQERDARALRRPDVHLEVAAVLPRVREPGGVEGLGARDSSPSGSASRPRRRSPSATARTTASCSTGPATPSASRSRTRRCSSAPTS